jgi:hypothetical protein
MKFTRLTVEWTLAGRGRKQAKAPDCAAAGLPLGKLPRVTRLMALAIKFEGMVARNEVRDYADLARLGFVTRARITQLMNLLNLAPGIQEQILFLQPTTAGRDCLSERSLRKLTAIALWHLQRKALNELTANKHVT